jgi:transposase
MTRRLGRCARGLRLLAPVPHGHWKTTTLVAGLRTTGITAPYVLDGAMNGATFRA